MHTRVKYWGGADVDHTQIIGGGYSQIIGGICSPHPPRVSAPLPVTLFYQQIILFLITHTFFL